MGGEPDVNSFELLFELIKVLTYDGTNIFNGPHDRLPDEPKSDKQVHELVRRAIEGQLETLSEIQLHELDELFERHSG